MYDRARYSSLQMPILVQGQIKAQGTVRSLYTGSSSFITEWPLNFSRIEILRIGIDGVIINDIANTNLWPAIEFNTTFGLFQDNESISFAYSNDASIAAPQIFISNFHPYHEFTEGMIITNLIKLFVVQATVDSSLIAGVPGTVPATVHAYLWYRDASEGFMSDDQERNPDI